MPHPTLDACPCGATVEAAYPRHATRAEYDALPEGLKPIDGYAVTAVRVCGDCLPGPICAHPDPDPAPCPVCHAPPGEQCVKPGGTPRTVEHRERATAHPAPETCAHAHRETCTDPRACACSGDDPPPARAPRIIHPAGPQQQLADLGVPVAMIPTALDWAHRHDVDLTRVRGGFRSGYTQDNRPAFLFDYAQGDDGHGHEVLQPRVEPLD